MNNDLLNKIFSRIAEELDISDTAFDRSVTSYTALGEYLNNQYDKKVEVYTQGSFRLGTVIRPLNDEDEYDLDLVCEIKDRIRLDAKTLKKDIGNLLADSKRYSERLEEKKRCWRIEYSDEAHFHIDITPAVTNPNIIKALLITNKENNGNYTFTFSNPKGFSDWFEKRKLSEDAFKRSVLLRMAGVEPVNTDNHRNKFPLQRAIQILKRHRDIMFELNPDNKPISIIITTLAALSYDGEIGVYDSIKNILEKMSEYIVFRSGKYYILNPVDTQENFADKWNAKPEKAKAFFKWLSKAKNDIYSLANSSNEDYTNLENFFGETVVSRAALNLDQGMLSSEKMAISTETPLIQIALKAPHRKKPFFQLPKYRRLMIRAVVTQFDNGYPYINNGTPIPKNRGIDFYALVSPALIKGDYSVYWQIVNTGEEARNAQALRGDFVMETNSLKHHEDTLYKGTHYVIAYLMRSGKCIAMSNEFIVNIE